MLDHIKIYKPKSSTISKYVNYYYEVSLNNISYYAYPHYNLPVSIVNTNSINIVNNVVEINQTNEKQLSVFTVNKFTVPLKVTINGKIRDFCIVLKPYGLSNLSNKKIDLNSKEKNSIIRVFRDLPNKIPNFVYLDIDNKIDLLEEYLLSNLHANEDTTIVIEVFDYFFRKEKLSINEIAKLCNLHPKKVYRVFKNICGESPILYKRIVQFRKALEEIKNEADNLNLTHTAIDSNYYDQPAFNNAFKNLTGETPSMFFEKIDKYTSKHIYFKKAKK